MKFKLETVVGGMALLVVLYRIGFMMVPMIRKGVATQDIPMIFKSFTLIV
jgi:hypothetical protein